MAEMKTEKAPKTGEQTDVQRQGVGDQASTWFSLPGFGDAPHGSFQVYRQMRATPTVAISRIAATAPLRASGVSVEADDDAPDDAVELVTAQNDRHWPHVVSGLVQSLDFGFEAFEMVWVERDGHLVVDRFKPLLHDITKPRLDERGNLVGLENGKEKIDANKTLWYAYDGEAGNWYGRSRNENIRERAWHPWCQTITKLGQYVTKVSGVIPMVEYPVGVSRDRNGAEKSNFEIGEAVLQKLGQGAGVLMPNVFATHAQDFLRSGVDIDKLKAWHISFLETGGTHGSELVEIMRYLDTLMVRGWLMPERAVLEGQFGTKAEAAEHGDIADAVASLMMDEFLLTLNDQWVNRLLLYNYGPQVVGKVRLTQAGVSAEVRELLGKLLLSVLGDPVNASMLLQAVDVDAVLDNLRVPKKHEVVDLERDAGLDDDRDQSADPDDQLDMAVAARRIAKGLIRGVSR